ncbi:glycoside hydrolase family 43 protein [Humibacter albus]|uniref:glycoside hydrolase family 43 protein n=1 Tax=Humibacter albus TaxID=427754 RepID=UPI0003B66196|nr:glycoside hydrolase family 43 protein [Humibacter albus]
MSGADDLATSNASPVLEIPTEPHPVRPEYFADPFLTRFGGRFFAYGTSDPRGPITTFEAIWSDDLEHWQSVGQVLDPLDVSFGDAYWAPEVVERDGRFWMYYSVGHDIAHHHLRAASAETPSGPFVDCAVDLTPEESFAIDAHPFRDDDGRWYLYFARDVLNDKRPGTHLAVAELLTPTRLDATTHVALAPNADWQIYERDRSMYGRRFDWHTLEGPTVIHHGDAYVMFFSGGSWEGPGYGVSLATSKHPFGPWKHSSGTTPAFLSSRSTGLVGPGHNSMVRAGDRWVTAFHAWNAERTARQMYVAEVRFV